MKHLQEETQKDIKMIMVTIPSISVNNELLLTNTCFKHKQSHLTTWQQMHINKETNKIQHIWKVFNFIIIKNQYKHTLLNAPTYSGTC